MTRILILPAVALAATLAWPQQTASPDGEIAAMRDELARSREMSLPGLDRPYFIQYLIDEATNFSVSASLGGLLSERTQTIRDPEVRVRVGDYAFDNGNFTGGGRLGARYDLGSFPIENRYDVMRRYLWLETDSAYKAAVETLSRKRAALRNLTQRDKLNDFAHATPLKRLRPLPELEIDRALWSARVRTASGLFAKYPEVRDSRVDLESTAGGFTLVNTEGTEAREPETVSLLRIRASAQAPDGMTVRDAATFHALDPARLPGDREIARAAENVAENVTALARAPRGEDYTGPVLFEGVAGAQLFAELLGRNLGLTRRPVSDGGRGGNVQPGELDGRIGARVLPDSFDVVDDPTQTAWGGRPLFGHYEVDREGVAPAPVRVIEKGVLKGYLLTRQPVRGHEGSNGHARMPGSFGASAAGISNLVVRASDAVPAAGLKQKLIELCKARGKDYGIIVRKMDFPSSASFDEARRLLVAAQGGHPVSLPLLVYKVYPDGREELVRGVRFRGLNVRSLKDILAAGDDSQVFEFMDNTMPFALIAGARFTTEAAVIAPSVLVDDLELHPLEDELPKLPVAPPPDLTQQ